MLESIIRPYQAPIYFYAGTKVPIAPQPLTTDPSGAQLCWGGVGAMPTPTSNPGGFKVVSGKETETEKAKTRQQDLIRIENPNDSSQYIMVQRAKTLQMDHHQTKLSTPTSTSYTDTAFSDPAFAPTPISTDQVNDLTISLDNGPSSA